MGISAYKKTIKTTVDPREIERRILSRINAELGRFQERFDASDKHERQKILSGSLRTTITENQTFWSAIKVDLLSPTNQMPRDLRVSIASTATFVERHSVEVLAGRGDLQTLVEINQAIMSGLAGQAGEAA